MKFLITVDPDRPRLLFLRRRAQRTSNNCWRVYCVGTFEQLLVFDTDLFVSAADKRKILIDWRGVEFRIEILLASPCPRVVSTGVFDSGRAEDVATVSAFWVWVEVIGLQLNSQVGAAL